MKWTCKKIQFFAEHCFERWLSVRDRLAYKTHVKRCPGCRDFMGLEAPGVGKTAPKRWTCRKIELFLDDYLQDELSVQDKFTYEAHMETCPSCREYVDQTSAIIEHVRGEIAPRIRASVGQMPEQLLESISDAMGGLPREKQLLWAEALRRQAEEDDRRHKEWMEKVRRRRERVKPT
jgi:predicted anti-sigma-YlaC factor YlaD